MCLSRHGEVARMSMAERPCCQGSGDGVRLLRTKDNCRVRQLSAHSSAICRVHALLHCTSAAISGRIAKLGDVTGAGDVGSSCTPTIARKDLIPVRGRNKLVVADVTLPYLKTSGPTRST